MHARPVHGATAPPLKCGLVVFNRHIVELHGAQYRLAAQGDPAVLPRKAQHQRVDKNTVAQQLGGHLLGIERLQIAWRDGLAELGRALVSRILPTGVVYERGSGRAVRVKRHVRAALLDAGHGFFASADYRVAAKNHISSSHIDACGVNVFLGIGHNNVAPRCTAFLRQASRILRDHAFAFHVRSHT